MFNIRDSLAEEDSYRRRTAHLYRQILVPGLDDRPADYNLKQEQVYHEFVAPFYKSPYDWITQVTYPKIPNRPGRLHTLLSGIKADLVESRFTMGHRRTKRNGP